MRLWTIDPLYLDNKGLGGLWAEAILARKVLEGKTKGYKNHPALLPFKNIKEEYRDYNMNLYLHNIWYESSLRDLNYKRSLLREIVSDTNNEHLTFTYDCLIEEFKILQNKLKIRNHKKYLSNLNKYENDGIIMINKAFIVEINSKNMENLIYYV